MGFEKAEIMAHFWRSLKLVAAIIIFLGLFTHVGVFTTLIIMMMAIITKIPITFRGPFRSIVPRDLNTYGFWSMANEMRTDFAMWLGSMFLIIKGAGRWSLDRMIYNKCIHLADLRIQS
jgi:uncharacterized membrane protein YphA (DoxX/SURF4 family)